MMNMKDFFKLAQLAEASYARFDLFTTDKFKDALVASKFSDKQAEVFLADWQVVTGAHRPNTPSGYSSTLFKNTGGSYVLAIRGTEPETLGDLQADVFDIATDGIALNQIVDLYNEWQRIIAPTGQSYQVAKLVDLVSGGSPETVLLDMPSGMYKTIEFADSSTVYLAGSPYATGLGLADEIATKGLTVTGHSLGGHLAAAFTRLFPSVGADALTINGAGFATGAVPGLGGTARINIANLFGMLGGETGFDSAHILNLYGDRYPEFVTQDGELGLYQQGGHEAVYIEHVHPGAALGHGAQGMTDSLAVYDLFIEMDGSLQAMQVKDAFARLKPLFAAASNDDGQLELLDPVPNASLESLVNALAELFNTGTKISNAKVDDREELYLAINAIKLNSNYKLAVEAKDVITVQSLAALSSDQIVSRAQPDSAEGLAYRYALANLNPFVISGDGSIYASHNGSGELDLYDPVAGTGESPRVSRRLLGLSHAAIAA